MKWLWDGDFKKLLKKMFKSLCFEFSQSLRFFYILIYALPNCLFHINNHMNQVVNIEFVKLELVGPVDNRTSTD